jgi:hypothetical protein
MSQQLIDRNADLTRLKDDGYDIEIRSEKYLLINSVPYLNSEGEVKFGTLVSILELADTATIQPTQHVAYFIGEHPRNVDGSEIAQIRHSSARRQLTDTLCIDHQFSAKPKYPEEKYRDYHHKVETYVTIISAPAQDKNPHVTAKIYPKIEYSEEQSVFKYPETASSRAGIETINKKLAIGKIAIVGVGGTGSYILDLVAKTPVKEIHLFDGDEFLNHNAFRSPGAPTGEELHKRQTKVAYFEAQYSKMRWGIVPHGYYLKADTANQLQGMDFVFLCLDKGADKKVIVERLIEWGIAFIDVGVGVNVVDESLMGTVRTTLSTKQHHEHVLDRIPFSDGQVNNDYSRNIQIADLNALNATLAVIKWKKLFGFYQDSEREQNSFYSIAGNTLINEDGDEV